MKIRFKLIPFLLSLLIVIGTTVGICLYSYYDFDENKVRFLNEYYHLENSSEYSSSSIIENHIMFTANKYQKITSDLTFRDPVTKVNYTDVKNPNTDEVANPGAYYQNGVLHFPGSFDVEVYTVATEYNGEWNYVYNFFFYNIDYKNGDFNPENLRFVFVNGIGEGTAVEDDDKEFGDALLASAIEEIKSPDGGGGATQGAYVTYTYTGYSSSENNTNKVTYPVYDSGYKNDTDYEEKFKEENGYDYIHCVYSMSPNNDLNNHNIKDTKYYPDKEITFSIYIDKGTKDEEGNDEIEEIVQGTLKNIKSNEDYINQDNLITAYNSNVYLAGYSKVIWSKVLIHGVVAFVLSGIVAFLFYLVWMDDPDKVKKAKRK